MRFRAMLYHGADECWWSSDDDLLALLMRSNEAMANERRGRKGPCDGGVVFKDGAQILVLKNEHWTKEGARGAMTL